MQWGAKTRQKDQEPMLASMAFLPLPGQFVLLTVGQSADIRV